MTLEKLKNRLMISAAAAAIMPQARDAENLTDYLKGFEDALNLINQINQTEEERK